MEKYVERQKVIIVFFSICALLLVYKSAELQIFESKYREQARRTTLDKRISYPSRGLIYDRNNELLVVNTPIYDIKATYKKVDSEMDTVAFCDLLEISIDTFSTLLNKNWKSRRYHKSVPFTFLSKVKPETYAQFQERMFEFPGFYPVIRNTRSYPHQNAAHTLGYLGEVDQRTINKSNGKYQLGDFIGVSGVEKSYDDILRGSKGLNYLLKDNLGRDVGSYENGSLDYSAVSGEDINLALDLVLQEYGELLMRNKKGAIVALEPETGEVLAMISAPTYDPNILKMDVNRGAAFNALLSDTINKPMLDRSVISKYPPGSIFKPIFALIALQLGVTQPNKTIYCDGSYEVGKRGFSQGCRNHPTPYGIDVALQWSCNSYFYQLMKDCLLLNGYDNPGAGLDTLVNHLSDFGLGKKTGLDYHYENEGFIPDSKYYNRLYKDVFNGWKWSYILSLGIGQGELELTTLQMANLAAILANRGHYYKPHLLRSINGDKLAIPTKYLEQQQVRINTKHFEPVINGMEKVISQGTATSAYVAGLDVCGKTGTSQNQRRVSHSVFFGFAPKVNPKIAIAVYVENAGSGGAVAAPIGGLIIEKYINKDIAENRIWLQDEMINRNLLNSHE
ncbi:penicillin-binding protein 2 [Saprospiraceae bacterium]|jgi:penicillin-binding protein 2|nr:penicillin-binding protein 2 [Saprospiraceae bacterium]HAV29965.1 penicillin-binding protein 2 [Saprospirales bacterium]